MKKKLSIGLGVALAAASATAGASAAPQHAASAQRASGTNLTVVAYSIARTPYSQLIPAFQATPAGQGVTFSQSFAASGDQARAVSNGLPADVVNLSLTPDVSTLVAQRLVRRDWNHGTFKGMVTNSIVVFVTRKGNPKKVRDWSDLIKPGISVITPNPFTSGGARWNVMAAYGAQIKAGKTPKQAVAYLGDLFKHVAVQDKSAAASLQTFLAGKGDVLLSYESDAMPAKASGASISIQYPKSTLLIENPIAVTSFSPHPTEAKAFLDFLITQPAQEIWAKNGYRPVLQSAFKAGNFPTLKGVFKISDPALGGWDTVQPKFFDPSGGIMAKIERSL
jgi:sulfate transport system substrate-binding protein